MAKEQFDYSIPEPQIIEGEQPIKSDELYATMLQEERAKNFIAQISPDNQLLELQWRIKGYVKNQLTQQWVKVDKNAPEPSPLLVSRYISFLSSLLNQNTTMSNLSPTEINSLMKLAIEWVTDDLDANTQEYGLGKFDNGNFIRDYSEMTRIGLILLNNTFMVLKRGMNGLEAQRTFKMFNITESSTHSEGKKNLLTEALQVWK